MSTTIETLPRGGAHEVQWKAWLLALAAALAVAAAAGAYFSSRAATHEAAPAITQTVHDSGRGIPGKHHAPVAPAEAPAGPTIGEFRGVDGGLAPAAPFEAPDEANGAAAAPSSPPNGAARWSADCRLIRGTC